MANIYPAEYFDVVLDMCAAIEAMEKRGIKVEKIRYFQPENFEWKLSGEKDFKPLDVDFLIKLSDEWGDSLAKKDSLLAAAFGVIGKHASKVEINE